METFSTIPKPSALREMRENLGLSQAELAEALGFASGGERTIRSWEKGERDGKPFEPTGLAWAAFRYLDILVTVYEELPASALRSRIGAVLPGCAV